MIHRQAESNLKQAADRLDSAKQSLMLAEERHATAVKQAECSHQDLDVSRFGDTCNDCGLYLNNGI